MVQTVYNFGGGAVNPDPRAKDKTVTGGKGSNLTEMAEIGLPLAIYNQFKPWLVAQDLALRELRQLGFNPIYGIDVYFFNKAKADGKEIEFLESLPMTTTGKIRRLELRNTVR